MKPLHLSFRKHCRAPLQAVWDVLADTDRFNRAAGMGFELSELADAEGGVRRVGKVTKLGFVQLEWEEQPVLYVRPDWFRVERVFVAGPAARVLVEVHLHADATGTAIHYDVSVQPRGLLHAAVVAAELHTATRMQLDRALDAAIRVIEGAEGGYDPEAPALSPAIAARLDERLAGVDRAVGAALSEIVRHAPLYRQARIMPRVLARQLERPDAEVARALCDATRGGALELRWELVCPSCLVPKASSPALWADGAAVHCTSCNIRFDATFPDAVQVVFRPAPDIRDVDVPVECLVSPGRTPHVLARTRVAAGGEGVLDVELESGGHRLLVGSGALGAAHLEVADDGVSRVEFALDRESGLTPARVRVRAGRVRVLVRSTLPIGVGVQVEQWWRPPLVLTAGTLLSDPTVADLLPSWSLGPGVVADTAWSAVVVALLTSPASAAVACEDVCALGHDALQARGRVLALCREPAAALEVARLLATRFDAAVSVDAGPVTRVDAEGARTVGGYAVERALDAVLDAGVGRVVASRPALDEARLGPALVPHVDAAAAGLETTSVVLSL